MKKLLIFVIIVCSFISCAIDDKNLTSETNTSLLQKVIFNANSTNENQRHWNFNSDGLLSQITTGNETILYTFSYDSNGRVILSTMLNPNGTTTTFNFAYNNDGSIASLNNIALNFDTTLNAFYFGDLNSNYRAFRLNSDGLLTYSKSEFIEIENGISYPFIFSQANISYADKNLKSLNFHNGTYGDFIHDNKINPIRNATLAVFKAFAITDLNESWLNSFAVSNNNVIRKNYLVEDFIHEEYVYEFNSNDLPISATLNFYDHNNLDFSVLKTLYYYQGDLIP